jgi:hypothetical protein
MGKIIPLNSKRFIIYTLLLVISPYLNAQNISITGNVTDSLLNPIPSTSIILKSKAEDIISYTYSDKNGFYKLLNDKTGEFVLIFNSLGFKKKNDSIKIEGSKNIIKNIILIPKKEALDEIIIEAKKPILVKEDTITFQSKEFIDGTEQTVEDLLKKIPGLQIDSEGTIKVGNQEIEKLMVDGDDFFEKGYKILSKNMPAHPIEEVEVYKNYSNNKLLKGIEDSKKVALNLKLSEEAKRIWFGNVELGYGNDSFYDTKANLMNFGKKNKYYFLTNLNNIGYNATGDINNLIRPMRFDEPSSIGDNVQIRNLINLEPPQLNFKKQRTTFNNAELLSLNGIFNPSDKLKIKALAFLNWNENDFFRNSTTSFFGSGLDFTNTEDFSLRNKKAVSFGKLDFQYDISKTQFIESTTKYNYTNFEDSSNLVFNGLSTKENLESRNQLFDQKISYTNRFRDKKVLIINSRFIAEETPQDYRVNQFLFSDVFEEEANNVNQLSKNKYNYFGINAHFMDRRQNGNLFELQLGNEYRKDRLNSSFSLLSDDNIINNPTDYQNDLEYGVNDLYVKSKYKYKIGKFGIIGKLQLHQLFNRLEIIDNSVSQTPFFINPSLGLGWEINDSNKITANYSINRTNAQVLDVYPSFVQTGFRSFNRGTGEFNQLDASSLIFNYQLGKWTDRFFANTFVMYTKSHDFFSTNSTISQNLTQTEKILIEDRDFLNISTTADYYFKKISTNLKFKLGYSYTEFKNIVNNSELRQVSNNNYNYGLELRSGFDGWFNFHFGTKWLTSQVETTTINSFTNNESFLDLLFIFNSKFNAQLQSERYFFGNLEDNNVFYFLDFDVNYKFKNDKYTISLIGKNLFNEDTFRSFSISDISTSTTEIRLLERYFLLSFKFRF